MRSVLPVFDFAADLLVKSYHCSSGCPAEQLLVVDSPHSACNKDPGVLSVYKRAAGLLSLSEMWK